MTLAATRFEGRGPVARYWLAHCEGFVVTGDTRGVVEELIRDADPFVTTRLVIRTRLRRRRTISARAVAAVVPADGTLVVRHSRKRLRAHREVRQLRGVGTAKAKTGAVRLAGKAETPARVVACALASARAPAKAAARAAGTHAIAFVAGASSAAKPLLLVCVQSLHSIALELRATGGLLTASMRRAAVASLAWAQARRAR